MDVSILVDPVNEQACLVDDDTGYAFGPVFKGEDCLAKLDLFVTLTGDTLDRFNSDVWAVAARAVEAMIGAGEPVPGEPVEPAAPAAPPLETTPPPEPSPQVSPPLEPEPAPAPADDDREDPSTPGGEPSSPPPATTSNSSPDAAASERPIGAEDCWQCGGDGMTLVDDVKVTCDICDGLGYIARAGVSG